MFTFREFIEKKFSKTIIKGKIAELKKILINLFTIPSGIHESLTAHDITLKYWTDPESPLIDWLKSLDINVAEGVPPFVDGGAGRCYFLTKPRKVVKMSANRVEANVASMLAGNEDVPVPVIAVKYLGNNIYAILQHLVDTRGVPQKIREASDLVTVLIDDNPEMDGFPESEEECKKLCLKTLRENDKSEELLPEMLLMVDLLKKIYSVTGFKHDDAGPTNIGMHKGKVVVTDLGPNQTAQFNTLAALSQIQKNREKIGLPRWKSI